MMSPDELLASLPPEEAKLLERYWALPPGRRTEDLDDIADRVARYGYFASSRQMGFFGARLREVEGGSDRPPRHKREVPVEEPPVTRPAVDDFPWR